MGTYSSDVLTSEGCPVEFVSWYDVQEFIKRLNSITQMQFRLPTEAEWEYAARGGNMSQSFIYSGSNNLDEVAWHGTNNSTPKAVGLKNPNKLGLYDMSGNVYEWCADNCKRNGSRTYTYVDGFVNPQSTTGSSRIIRGGAWQEKSITCHVSYRNCADDPYSQITFLGFRLSTLAPR